MNWLYTCRASFIEVEVLILYDSCERSTPQLAGESRSTSRSAFQPTLHEGNPCCLQSQSSQMHGAASPTLYIEKLQNLLLEPARQ